MSRTATVLRMPRVGALVLIYFLSIFSFANFEATLARLTESAFSMTDDGNFLVFAFIGLMLMLAGGFYRPLAKRLELETGYDQDGKFMAGRELVSRDVTDPKTGEAQIESIILSVSTVASHPGKTLAGCTYSLDLPEDEPAPAAPAPATGSH